MNKLGKIKSWYIDPDDNRVTSTQHNILFVNIINCDKYFYARHDDVESDDYDANVEINSFKLADKTFNARFADIYGRMNYCNINE